MEITELLHAAQQGDPSSVDRLYAAIYDELHRIAAAERRRWSGQETLNATALVHEAFLKLVGPRETEWKSRGHFFAVAARAMRHVMVDYAERGKTAKRGGDRIRVPIDEADAITAETGDQILALHAALERMEATEPRRARVVECRFFAGLPVTATAEALQISPATVKREWALARVWLFRQLREGGEA